MKQLMAVTEVDGEGLVSLLGKRVLLFCLNYIYVGTLTGVNNTFVKLAEASIVYETGAFDKATFTDAQKLAFPLYIQTEAIESFSETNKK